MISINDDRFKIEWQTGMTVARLLKVCSFSGPHIAVFVNGILVQPQDYGAHVLHDGDQVRALHLVAGG